MTIAETVRGNWNKIFSGDIDFGKYLSSISAPAGEVKAIDPWITNSEDMLPTKGTGVSGSTVRVVPRIKSKTERNWIRGQLKSWFEKNLSTIQERVNPYLPSDKNEVYTWEITESVITGTSLPSLIIAAKKDPGARPTFRFVIQPKGLTAGPGGKREDPHELMTAILVRLQKKVIIANLNKKPDAERQKAYKELVDELAANANKVTGGSGLAGFYVDGAAKNEPDLVNLAKALSVSNFIIQKIGKGKVNAVWQTGKQWASEISKFNPSSKDIKNYNSSDIIIKFTTTSGVNPGVHYWGISLKKKGITDAEPTLLNKPLMGAKGFIEKKMKPPAIAAVEKAKKDFFVGAIKTKLGSTKYKNKDVTKMSMSEVLKTANSLFTEKQDKNNMLTGRGQYKGNPNIYFKELHTAFMGVVGHSAAGKVTDRKKAADFSKEFMDLIFKINMDQYIKDGNFHFSLVTGVGDYKAGSIVQVEAPLEKEGKTTSEIFKSLWKDPDNVSYRFVPGRANSGPKKMAFDEGAEAAKLFYEMMIGPPGAEHSIVMLEVRYKGALTSEPQFQVFMSTRPNSFSNLYKKIAKQKGSAIRRW